MKPTSRRRLLSTTLLASGTAVAAGPALALSIEPLDGPLEESYLSACGGDPNHQGFVDEVRPDKEKVRVMVQVFGRATPVELDYTQLEKA